MMNPSKPLKTNSSSSKTPAALDPMTEITSCVILNSQCPKSISSNSTPSRQQSEPKILSPPQTPTKSAKLHNQCHEYVRQ
eukprot:1747293-Amphidinium_carterae.1